MRSRAQIAVLKLISRTSTPQYQSKTGNLPQIAKEFGVAHVLVPADEKSEISVVGIATKIRTATQQWLEIKAVSGPVTHFRMHKFAIGLTFDANLPGFVLR